MTPLRQPRGPDPAPRGQGRPARDPANDNTRPRRELAKLVVAWGVIGAAFVLAIWAAG